MEPAGLAEPVRGAASPASCALVPAPVARVAGAARRRRYAELLRRFPDLERMRVLDLGGVPGDWSGRERRPERVVTVNLDPVGPAGLPPWLRCVQGDACALPAAVRSERFDLVYSNSVLEHVGGHWRRQAFADTVHAAADRHWVQTPYRYFPLEPHWLFPGFQFLPVAARMAVSRRWPFGHIRSVDAAVAFDDVAGVELLTATELRHYFPTSELWPERVAGLTKSLVAVRPG